MVVVFACAANGQMAAGPAAPGPYKIVNTVKAGGAGGFDYVYADSGGRKLYVPRGNRVDVFDLPTLGSKSAGSIALDRGRMYGAAVDPKSKHGFCSSNARWSCGWDTETLKTIKTIDVKEQAGRDSF